MAGRYISAGSRPIALAKIDGRSPEARLIARTRADLTRHVGGKPTAVQKALINRIAILTMHVARIDKRAIEKGGMSEADSRTYLAHSNSLCRALGQLGLQSKADQPVVESLESIAREIEEAEAAAKPTAEPSASIEREAA